MKLRSFFAFVLVVFWANACSKTNDDLLHYKTIIPEEEAMNASLLHHEWLKDKIESAYDEREYKNVLRHIGTYTEVFRSTSSSAFVDYHLGVAIGALVDDEWFDWHLREVGPEMRRVYGVKRTAEGFEYDHRHLSNLVEQRKNYAYERRAIEVLFPLGLAKATTSAEQKQNLDRLNWALKRYPDALVYRSTISNRDCFNPSLMATKPLKDEYEELVAFFDRYEHNRELLVRSSSGLSSGGVVSFPNTYFCVVRNRTHELTSRNLLRLQMWEPLEVFESDVEGEDGKTWALVLAQGSLFGYVLQSQLDFVLSVADRRELLRYAQLCNEYYNGHYVGLGRKLVARIDRSEGIWKERYLVLLNASLKEIAKRATSKNNPYTEFAYRHPKYFQLSGSRQDLIPSFLVLRSLLKANESSLFLPYFGGSR